MNQEQFLEKVVCPRCETKMDNKVPFNSPLVCVCRQSKCMSTGTSTSFKLNLNSELSIFVQIFNDKAKQPYFYIAAENRPFYPLYKEDLIPDFIFLPLDQLIHKVEILATFS